MQNHTSFLTKLSLIALTTIMVGCSTTAPRMDSPLLKGLPPSCENNDNCLEQRNKVQQFNQQQLNKQYKEEWQFNATEKAKPPQLGLALSGGGTRAASFSIGVLKALHEEGILNKVDVLSAVSGGSYAAYWLYQQHYYMDKIPAAYSYTRNTIFNSFDFEQYGYRTYDYDHYKNYGATGDNYNILCSKGSDCPRDPQYRFQRHLETYSDILARPTSRPGQLWDYTLKGGAWLISYPTHIIANGLFDTQTNLNPLRRFYENGLERTYGLSPLDFEGEKYANDTTFLWANKAHARDLDFTDLKTWLLNNNDSKNRLPYLVVNTTTGYGNTGLLWNKFGQFESTLTNRIFEFTPLHYGSSSYGYTTSESSVSLSRSVSISGAAVDSQAESKFTSLLTAMTNTNLGYYIPNYNKSTFNRSRQYIPFPFYYFASGTAMDISAPHIYLSDGGHAENLGVFSLVRRGVGTIIVVDAENDTQSGFEGVGILKRALKQEFNATMTLDTDKINNVYDAKTSIITGTISDIPGICGSDSCTIKLIYVKLSMQKKKMAWSCTKDCYPLTVMNYHNKKPSIFPHEPTTDIEYSADQFRAYRDLGHYIGKGIKQHL